MSCCFHTGHTGWKINDLNPIWVRLPGWSQLSNPSDLPCFLLSQNFGIIGHLWGESTSHWCVKCLCCIWNDVSHLLDTLYVSVSLISSVWVLKASLNTTPCHQMEPLIPLSSGRCHRQSSMSCRIPDAMELMLVTIMVVMATSHPIWRVSHPTGHWCYNSS